MSAPVTPEAALKIIRTWAAFERDNPGVVALVPEHVIELCDEALGIVSGKEAAPPTPQEVPDGGR